LLKQGLAKKFAVPTSIRYSYTKKQAIKPHKTIAALVTALLILTASERLDCPRMNDHGSQNSECVTLFLNTRCRVISHGHFESLAGN
jgi:hypothetical protein